MIDMFSSSSTLISKELEKFNIPEPILSILEEVLMDDTNRHLLEKFL